MSGLSVKKSHAQKGKQLHVKVHLHLMLVFQPVHIRHLPQEILLLWDVFLHLFFRQVDARQAQIVEMRFFGGLTEDEIADVLGICSRTVKRDWKLAKAWLFGELAP